jgi:hypothetical protein
MFAGICRITWQRMFSAVAWSSHQTSRLLPRLHGKWQGASPAQSLWTPHQLGTMRPTAAGTAAKASVAHKVVMPSAPAEHLQSTSAVKVIMPQLTAV